MSFDKLNGFIINIHFDQSCPRHMSAASVLVLALYSVIRQLILTLFWKNVSAGPLKVKHWVIEGVVMWITTDGAGAPLHCLAREIKGSSLADLGEGAGLVGTQESCWGAYALLCTGAVTPERITKLHRLTLKMITWKVTCKMQIWCADAIKIHMVSTETV